MLAAARTMIALFGANMSTRRPPFSSIGVKLGDVSQDGAEGTLGSFGVGSVSSTGTWDLASIRPLLIPVHVSTVMHRRSPHFLFAALVADVPHTRPPLHCFAIVVRARNVHFAGHPLASHTSCALSLNLKTGQKLALIDSVISKASMNSPRVWAHSLRTLPSYHTSPCLVSPRPEYCLIAVLVMARHLLARGSPLAHTETHKHCWHRRSFRC